MSTRSPYRIAVLPGDGIGPEVTRPALELTILAGQLAGNVQFETEELAAGAGHYQKTGVSIPDEALNVAREADAIYLGAMGLPGVRYPDGTEIAPQLELRELLNLYAGVRPVRTIPGVPVPLSDPRAQKIDFVLVRESTEGLFASRGKCQIDPDRKRATDTMVITRDTSQRLFEFTFELACVRKKSGFDGRVTCVDKANVLGAFAFFRGIFDDVAKQYPQMTADYCYVDAAGLLMVKKPWDFDVLVTENMFGDILSDVGAGLMGGMGFAASADIGMEHAVFQPCHGSAPDITGKGIANPVAAILSGAMMLEWLGQQRDDDSCNRAGALLRDAVDRAFANGKLIPFELGGQATTRDIANAVESELRTAERANNR